MTEIFNRRLRGARSHRAPARALAALAAATTVGAMLPLLGTAAAGAAAATSCLAPTGLAPNAGTTATGPELKDPVLTWTAPSDAPIGTKYDLEFSPNQDYTTNIAFQDSTTSTRYDVPVMALAHGSYFWRVRVDGRSCWSDDNGSSAEFTTGWRARPTLTFPANGATVAAPDLRFSWRPVSDASSYLLEVIDSSGALSECVTQATSYTPYDTPASAMTDAERVTANAGCDIKLLSSGSYAWRVLPLDDTKVVDNIAPYKGVYGVDAGPGPTAPHDSATVSTLVSDIGAPSNPDYTFTIAGSPASTSNTMDVKASLVNADGQTFTDCDVADSGVCPTTPTIRWTPIAGAGSYRVTLATDQHFTNNVRVYDTNYDSITPIDELLDSQAGQAYFIRVCSDNGVCTTTDSDTPQTNTSVAASSVPSFRKETPVVGGLGVVTSSSLTFTPAQVTLGWSDPAASNGYLTSPADYEVQVSSTCDFGAISSAYTTDATEVTDVFGAGDHFWRVRSVDGSGSPGPWSVGNSLTPVCTPASTSFTVSSQSGSVSTGTNAGITVDVSSSTVKKSGHWVKRNAPGASSGSALVTDGKKKQAITYTFHGSFVIVDYCKGPVDGYFSIYVDGKLRKTLNSNQSFTSCGKSFTIAKLASTKFHKLVVQASDKKGSTHGGTQLVLDYLKVA